MFNIASFAASQGGEYVLGTKDLHSKACYMLYGILKPREADRLIKPGHGREEILCVVEGTVTMHTSKGDVALNQGCAVHIKGDDSFLISNPSETSVIYIIAGGNSSE